MAAARTTVNFPPPFETGLPVAFTDISGAQFITDGPVAFTDISSKQLITDEPVDFTDISSELLPEDGLYLVEFAMRCRMGLCGLGLLLNAFIMAVQVRIKCYRDTKFMFGVLLTVSDIVIGLSMVTYTVYYLCGTIPIPRVVYVMLRTGLMMKQLSVLGVGVDRSLALAVFPLQYKYRVSVKKYAVALLVTVVSSLSYGLYFGHNYEEFLSPSVAFAVYLTFCATSLIIYLLNSVSLARSFGKIKLAKSVRARRLQQSRRILVAFTIILILELAGLPEAFFALWLSTKSNLERFGVFRNVLIYHWLYNVHALRLCCDPLIYWWQFLFGEAHTYMKRMRGR